VHGGWEIQSSLDYADSIKYPRWRKGGQSNGKGAGEVTQFGIIRKAAFALCRCRHKA
jgi:hypothetical protein